MSTPIESPCVDVCQLVNDASLHGGGYCIGCLRSLHEIAAWGQLSLNERRQVMADLPRRRDRVENKTPESE